jgi:nucleoside-diphosphate-sugar epimerase
MKILVTGGSGFIGTNVIEYYNSKGDDIINIDIAEPKIKDAYKFWVKCDIRDYQELSKIVNNFQPDYIIHLAARTDLDGKDIKDYDSNTVGVLNILRAADSITNLKKILITSSMLVCKVGYIPRNQQDYCPTTNYGKSKVETENITWANEPKCDWALLRPTSIWGPWFGYPYRAFFDMVKHRMYFHIGHVSCTKTYGYIENIVYQIDQILMNNTTNKNNKVFYLGDKQAINIEDWANQIAAEMGYKVRRIPLWIIKCAANFGDLFWKMGIHFPMSSFRLKNMSTDNIINLDNTYKIAPKIPVDRITGVKKTLEWMNSH